VPNARICSATASALLLLAIACAGDDLVLPSDGPAIQVVDGDGQSGTVGETLEHPVIVEVRDASGKPLANATVEFAFTSAGDGAEISPSIDLTNEAGQAQAQLQLGDKVGPQTGEAHLILNGGTVSTAGFTAHASATANQPPQADFNWHCDALSCQFTDASVDPDGDIALRSWDFGDEVSSGEAELTHVYAEPGTYTVVLQVTDNGGATDQTETAVTVSLPPPPENQPPRADFEDHCHERFCSFTDESSDEDGDVVTWSWDFGDGFNSNLRNPIHFYQDKGHYDVTLTVTDDKGATGSQTRRVDPKH
jgi:PKD repeat protein